MSNERSVQSNKLQGMKTIPIVGLLFCCAYFLSPVDLIPDGVPGSSLDDLALLFIVGGLFATRINAIRDLIVTEVNKGGEYIAQAADLLEATNKKISRLLFWIRVLFVVTVLSSVTGGVLAIIYRDQVVNYIVNVIKSVWNFIF